MTRHDALRWRGFLIGCVRFYFRSVFLCPSDSKVSQGGTQKVRALFELALAGLEWGNRGLSVGSGASDVFFYIFGSKFIGAFPVL